MSLDSSSNDHANPLKPRFLTPDHTPWDTGSWDCLCSRGHYDLQPAPIRSTSLHVTGEVFGDRYRVDVNGIDRFVRPAQFEYLLELLIAAYSSPDRPDLFIWDTVCTEGDPDRTRHAVQRLREDTANFNLIANQIRGGYRLTIPPTEIRLSDSLWRLPAQLVSQSILSELRNAHAAYWTNLMNMPESVLLLPHIEEVMPLSSTDGESHIIFVEIGLHTVVIPSNVASCEPGTHSVTASIVCSTADFD